MSQALVRFLASQYVEQYAGVGGEERFEVRGKKVINTFHIIE
jgi:hypothetical protein